MTSLWQALSTVVETPAVPGLAAQVQNAKTPFEAVTIATGMPPPGFVPPKPVDATLQQVENKLLPLFDRTALKRALQKRGKPVGPDGAGLPLASLDMFQALRSGIQGLLNDLEIGGVAAMSLSDFALEADKRGIESSRFKEMLGRLHDQCGQVMAQLQPLPPTWTLDADRL